MMFDMIREEEENLQEKVGLVNDDSEWRSVDPLPALWLITCILLPVPALSTLPHQFLPSRAGNDLTHKGKKEWMEIRIGVKKSLHQSNFWIYTKKSENHVILKFQILK